MLPEQLGAHIPWGRFDAYIDLVLSLGLAPEVAIKGPELDQLVPQRLERVAATFAEHGLRPTVHAPFFDLNPGALDPLVRSITLQRLSQALAFAAAINARLMVIHPGYDRWKYGGLDHLWVEQSLRFWPPLLERAARQQCILALENIFEEEPRTLATLLDEIDSPWLGHCFDVGHWNLFCKTPLDNWFELLGRHTRHIHLHDNRGTADDHLPVDQGQIDFTALFRHIYALQNPPSLTLEAHSARDLKKSLSAVQPYLQKRHELS